VVYSNRRQINVAIVTAPLAMIKNITFQNAPALRSPGIPATFMPNIPVTSVIGNSTAVRIDQYIKVAAGVLRESRRELFLQEFRALV